VKPEVVLIAKTIEYMYAERKSHFAVIDNVIRVPSIIPLSRDVGLPVHKSWWKYLHLIEIILKFNTASAAILDFYNK